MYSFNNDYSEGAHPQLLNELLQANLQQNHGYGTDRHSEHAAELIKQQMNYFDADIHFLTGGTQTNLITISAALRPHQAVIAADSGHINVHETGAVEATGHKVLTCPAPDGKLTQQAIRQVLDRHTDEHMVQPKMVYISNTTELGTIYKKAELEALSHFCRQNGLLLFLDGARLGSALTSRENDITLEDISRCTDVFYIGGTKNGALFGEALVICKQSLKTDFRFYMKQQGALLAKGWLLGIQFEQLFQNQLFYRLADHANQAALRLKDIICKCGYRLLFDSFTNLLFPIFPDQLIEKLEEQFMFSIHMRYDDSHCVIRLVTSWATTNEALEAFETALTLPLCRLSEDQSLHNK